MSIAWKISCGVSAWAMANGSPSSTTLALAVPAPNAFWKASPPPCRRASCGFALPGCALTRTLPWLRSCVDPRGVEPADRRARPRAPCSPMRGARYGASASREKRIGVRDMAERAEQRMVERRPARRAPPAADRARSCPRMSCTTPAAMPARLQLGRRSHGPRAPRSSRRCRPPVSASSRAALGFVGQADRHPAILARGREHVLEEHRRIGIARALRRARRACAAARAARICCTQISYIEASMWHPRPVSRRACKRGGGAGRHHVRHDHVAIRHRAGDHRIAVRPAGQVGAARQRAAGAVDAPFLRQRPGLAVDAARDHHDAGVDRAASAS